MELTTLGWGVREHSQLLLKKIKPFHVPIPMSWDSSLNIIIIYQLMNLYIHRVPAKDVALSGELRIHSQETFALTPPSSIYLDRDLAPCCPLIEAWRAGCLKRPKEWQAKDLCQSGFLWYKRPEIHLKSEAGREGSGLQPLAAWWWEVQLSLGEAGHSRLSPPFPLSASEAEMVGRHFSTEARTYLYPSPSFCLTAPPRTGAFPHLQPLPAAHLSLPAKVSGCQWFNS